MKTALTFVWHFVVVALVLGVIAAGFGLWHGADFHYGHIEAAYRSGDEGPHVFREGDRWVSHTVRGNGQEGFRVETRRHAPGEPFRMDVAFPLDASAFTVQATPHFVTPPARHRGGGPILAISDIEGNYKAFRDFLIHAKVMDADLNWTFGTGHLVLLGDFVDRGASVTQVLWLIYRLEQSAAQAGGRVHYLLGNHEIKNLQANFQSNHEKYASVAAILGRPQSDLFGENAFLAQWLASRNTIEVIDGILFVHGGLHPALIEKPWSLEDINRIVRENYRRTWYPKQNPGSEDFLIDPRTGPSWYRGYFKGEVTQEQMEKTLARFDATSVVVGHTLHWRVKALFENKVFAIDVRHPADHRASLPPRSSEGLWLEGGKAWRVLEDGRRVAL